MRGFISLGRHGARKLATMNGSGVKTVSAEEAQKLLKEGYNYLDVRTTEEFAGGHVENAVNIPYKVRSSTGMSSNPKFAEEVSAKFEKDSKLVVACQGGMRSAAAAKELQALEFTNLVDMSPGFGGWTGNGLPVTK